MSPPESLKRAASAAGDDGSDGQASESGSASVKKQKLCMTADEKVEKKRREAEERETKRLLAEIDKAEKQEKKRLAQLDKDNKRKQAEQERDARRAIAEVERAQREEKRKVAEEEREAKRRAIEQEKETKRKAIEQDKEAKRIAAEEKRRLKDEAEAAKQAEIDKKERLQPRLNNFFTKVKAPAAIVKEQSSAEVSSAALDSTAAKPSIFKPFHVRDHARLRKLRCKHANHLDASTFVASIGTDNDLADTAIQCLRQDVHGQRRRELRKKRVVPLRDLMNDEHMSSRSDVRGPPYKLLQYKHQDYRPPYWGTVTCLPQDARGLVTGRNPLARTSKLNYDYDSEAEWQSEGEGEDLLDDEDDEDGSDAGSEYSKDTLDEEDRAFLDDSQDGDVTTSIPARAARARLSGQMTAIVINGLLPPSQPNHASTLAKMSLRRLVDLDSPSQPIDPFKDYWTPAPTVTNADPSIDPSSTTSTPVKRFTAKEKGKGKAICQTGIAGLPMHAASANALNLLRDPVAVVAYEGPSTAAAAASVTSGDDLLVPAHLMPAFKSVVAGSTLSKVLLVERLRAEFGNGSGLFDGTPNNNTTPSKISKKIIERTLNKIAKRAGRKDTDVWVLI
ncbi:chromatin assembly factor-I (CAF-I) p90 subunit [Savitreella phatthalungensis]